MITLPSRKKWISLIPQGKMGQPEDLMGAVTFLCSDASRYVDKYKQTSPF